MRSLFFKLSNHMDAQNDKYNGYSLSDEDIIIGQYRLICTSVACPEQYDVFDSVGNQTGYLRLRHGYFRADYPDHDGDTVYEAHTKGDGMFDEDERTPQLAAAVAALDAAHARAAS